MVGEFMGRDLRTESRGETGSFPLGRVLFPIDEGHTHTNWPTDTSQAQGESHSLAALDAECRIRSEGGAAFE